VAQAHGGILAVRLGGTDVRLGGQYVRAVSGLEPPQQVERARPPRTVLSAVRLMYAGAALEVVSLIVALVTRGRLKSAILNAHPHYTSAQLHTAENFRPASW